ncbi:MAG: hypothetical protein QM647_06685 [Asticcacaulis sp.]|uniref:hypothetical protein n=1 Tax=Asticcacaulis sp. TaxID=1872648 RepID=UPI0039E35292
MTAPIPILFSDDDLHPFIGEQVGIGVNRTVYRHNGRDDVVIKVQNRLPCRANFTEWLLWNQMHGQPALRALFARVWGLSDSGRYLVMERLLSLDERPLPPFPAFVIDRKRENYGLSVDGLIKCLDYGDISLSDTLVKADLI